VLEKKSYLGGDFMQVKIYSTTTCPYCKMLKDYLKEKGISYEEKLVDQEEAAKDEMVEESGGFMGVPFTVITKDDGSKDTIVGFDKGKVDQLLRIV
jgi:glutaredoxin-like YruB-family protein